MATRIFPGMMPNGNQPITKDYLNDQLYKCVSNYNSTNQSKESINLLSTNIADLIRSGADVNFVHWTGSTPLLTAVQSNYASVVIDCLLQNKVDVNIPGKGSLTALEVAASKGNTIVVEKLCLFGARDINKALTYAAQFNQLQVVQYLTRAQKADVNNIECRGWTPLAKAVSTNKKHYGKNCLEVAKYLVNEGADVNKLQANGNTALTEAVREQDDIIVSYLLSVGADVNIVGEGGMTPLGAAATKGLLEIVQNFNEKGADLNKCDPQGNTPLTHAAEGGYEDVVRYLLGKEVDVYKAETGGQTPLAAAAFKGHLNIVKLLVEKKSNLNPIIGDNPLIVATKNGHREVAKYLVSEGANVNKMDSNKNCSLLFAVENSDLELIEFLINHGGSYMVHSVLLNSVSKQNLEILELLIQRGANVNMSYKSGITSLMKAVDVRNIEIVRYLLSQGANPNQADDSDNLPLIRAIRSGQEEIAEILLENGAAINTPDSKGNLPTAIFLEMHCIQKKHSQLIKLLVGKGLSSNTFCKCGYSLLTKFMQMDDYEMTTFLVANSADVNQKDNLGNLPLTVAATNTNYQILDFLIYSGADVELVREKFEEMAEDDISFSLYLESLNGNKKTQEHFDQDQQTQEEDFFVFAQQEGFSLIN